MARFVLFLILLVPLTVAGNWLLDHPGTIVIDWLDYTIEVHTALAAVVLFVVYILALLFALGIWQLATWPDRRRARKRYRTVARGLHHITQGMTALAIGNESAAETALKKARATLPGEPLPKLLTAQLLQRQGKQEAARTQLRSLLAHASTAQLATHKLIEQHLARHEWAEAIVLAEDARRDAPRDRWLALTLIDLHARNGNSAAIRSLTEGWHWQTPLTRSERHHYAGIAYLMGSKAETTPRGKLTALRHAYGYASDFLPVVIAYADALSVNNDKRAARKILLTAWKTNHAAVLIEPILQAISGGSARQQKRLLAGFTAGEHANVHLLAARHALEAGDYALAKQEAELALEREESKQACAIIAEAEKHRTGGAEAATVWLARGMDAPRAASWVCHQCGTIHEHWQLHCGGCDAFDTLHYERPEARITTINVPATR
jgi:HemY protein